MASSILSWIPSLITRSAQFFGILAIILYYDPTMAVIALGSAPVMLIVSKTLMKKMRDYNKRMRQVSSDVMSFNEESFQNIQSINCLLYTSDAADDMQCVDLGGRRIIKKIFFFKQKTAYAMSASLVGSEMCIRDRYCGILEFAYNTFLQLSLIHI